MRFIRHLDDLGRDDLEIAGGKGANLGELIKAGLPVPPGFVLTTAAYRYFVAASGIGDQVLAAAGLPPDAGLEAYQEPSAQIRSLFGSWSVPDSMAQEVLDACGPLSGQPLAVRSSATTEDLAGASFAGQQDTFLNVRGIDPLLAAIRDCWASLWTSRAMAYRARQGIDPAGLALAVVVQQMVPADAAGVMFTANPTNGRRDETVISAAWGLGESVVSGAVTTDDVVVEKKTGQVRTRTTADKAVMTVYTDQTDRADQADQADRRDGRDARDGGSDKPGGGTQERPVPESQRTRAVLDDRAASALAELGARIETHFGAPQDIEWARAGEEFWIVQARPITALPEPAAAQPTDWPLPDPRAVYFRASIVEQLPDPLTPLFADLVEGSVTRSLQRFMRDLLGSSALGDGDVGFPSINGYAYYRYSRAALLRLTLATPKAIRLLNTPDLPIGIRGWRNTSHPRYVAAVQNWADRPLGDLSIGELLAGVVELLDAGTQYYTAVQSVIPIAASSEVLFTTFYQRLVRRAGDPPAPTFLLGFDSAPIQAEKSLYDLSTWTRAHETLTAVLLAAPSTRVADQLDRDEPLTGVDEAVWKEWSTRLRAHLDRYGHSVYNLDFANPVPADHPAPLLDTLRFYLGNGGADPHERQRASAARRDTQTDAVLARLDPLRRRAFTRLLRWAQASAPVREDALADIGLAWPQLRRMLRELGRRLTAAGVIDRVDDVFWLRRDEILGDRGARLADVVDDRKALWRGRQKATPPQMLPLGTWMDSFDSWMPAASTNHSGMVLTGTGASAGQVTASARVLAGPQDFGRMQGGDVLVASITTPAWTSLFAMASAVVTDVGGPLSHSSIVAREYGIPAVLGTGVATRRIVDGARVHVDGDAGTVTLLDAGQDAPAAQQPPPGGMGASRRLRAVGAVALAGAAAAGVLAWRRRRPTR
jgi:phosphohistidine swiveling domain-containing protein